MTQPIRPRAASSVGAGNVDGYTADHGYPEGSLRAYRADVRRNKKPLTQLLRRRMALTEVRCHRGKAAPPKGYLVAVVTSIRGDPKGGTFALDLGMERLTIGADGEEVRQAMSERVTPDAGTTWIACKCGKEHLVDIGELARQVTVAVSESGGDWPPRVPPPVDVRALHLLT